MKFINADQTTLIAGKPANFSISASVSGAAITETGKLPAGLSFRQRPGGKAVLAGALNANTGGLYRLTLTATKDNSQVSQSLTIVVDQSPSFISGDPTQVADWTGRTNEEPIVVTGYPTPVITETGNLPSGISFQPLPKGGALISGSPGVFETPCTSELSLAASNGVGAPAVMSVTVNLKNVRCALSASMVLSIINNAIKIGPTVFSKGKVAGLWIVQQGRNVGQVVMKNGKPIAAATEQDAVVLEEGEE